MWIKRSNNHTEYRKLITLKNFTNKLTPLFKIIIITIIKNEDFVTDRKTKMTSHVTFYAVLTEYTFYWLLLS